MNGWLFSVLLHGTALVLAAYLADGLGRELGRTARESTEGALETVSVDAILRSEEAALPGGERVPDSVRYGPLTEPSTPEESIAEEPPLPRVPVDVFALDPLDLPTASALGFLPDPLPWPPGLGELRTRRFAEAEEPQAHPWIGGGEFFVKHLPRKPRAPLGARSPATGANPWAAKLGTGIVSLARSPRSLLAGLSGAPAQVRSLIDSWASRLPASARSLVRAWPALAGRISMPGRIGGPGPVAERMFTPAAAPTLAIGRVAPGPHPDHSSLNGTDTRIFHSALNGSTFGPRGGASCLNGTEFRGRP